MTDEATFRIMAARVARWQRGGTPIVGTANAQDVPAKAKIYCYAGDIAGVPVLRDAVRGPGSIRPRAQSKRAAIPYLQQLMALLRPLGVPPPRAEYRFAKTRAWRFDFAWPTHKLALEIDGGLWIDGAHNRGAALLRQYEKQNAATLAGWRILRYAPDQITIAAHDVAAVLRP